MHINQKFSAAASEDPIAACQNGTHKYSLSSVQLSLGAGAAAGPGDETRDDAAAIAIAIAGLFRENS